MQAMPQLGFGTYGRTGEAGIEAISCALQTGYRHLDTAQDYDTEAEVGAALRAAGLPREDVFVTTKVRPANFAPGALVPSLEKSCETLGLGHVDLALIHWPAPNGERPLSDYIPQLVEAKERGLTRHIGVSNFTIALLDETLAMLDGVPLLTNQVELNPWFRNRKLADHCTSRGVTVTCYQPIAKGRLGSDPVMKEIADAHDATPEQIALAFEMSRGYAAIPTSGKAERIRSNFGALDIRLTEGDINRIEGLDRGQRAIDPDWGPDWD
ncbi:2,5-diketo-D-gluconate reductase B [Wenxinia marina]|nr:2,5-diketo-D-gluconate reductase B [Wenxinia marina]